MIEEYYGFSAAPFSLSPDARFFYDSPGHRQALAYLRFGLQQGEGFIVITGEIGAGKSTLINRLLDELDRNTIEVAYITTSNVDPDDVLRLIASQFNIIPATPDKATLLRSLEGYLTRQRRLGRRVLVIIDEAQNLPMNTIEELRMLSNQNVDGQSAIQCFLVGQPQFKAIISDPNMEQLRQRVIASYHLDTLSEPETKRYIEHRLFVVGWTGRPEFTDGTMSLIYRRTGGVPRRINSICSRLLMHGALDELDVIDEDAASEIINEMGSEVAESSGSAPGGGWTAHANPGSQTGQANAATDQFVLELSGRLQTVEKKLAGLERNQEALAKSLASLRNLESRINTLETYGGGDNAALGTELKACTDRLQALDQRVTEALAAPTGNGPDLTALQDRLAQMEQDMQQGGPTGEAEQSQYLARLRRDMQTQSEILQDVMTVTMSLLGHGHIANGNDAGRKSD